MSSKSVAQADRERRYAGAIVPTIFHEPWWLDAATDGRWRQVTVESGGHVMGRLPYLPDRKFTGQTSLVMPRLTRCLGPAIRIAGTEDGCVRQPSRQKIVKELLSKLPRHSHLWMQMHRGVHDTMAFTESGYETLVRYTTEITPADRDDLWAGMRDKTRNVIRRAEEIATVTTTMSGDAFLDFYAHACRLHARRNDYHSEACERVVNAAIARNKGKVYAAQGEDGETDAAILVVRDDVATYYLMSARDPRSHNGMVSLLLWHAIRDAAAAGLIFDTDGLSTENHMLVTGLGGVVRPRYVVTRTSCAHAAVRTLKTIATSLGRPAA